MSVKSKSSWQDIVAMAESILEKQHSYFEPCLAQLRKIGRDTSEELGAIRYEVDKL